MKILNCFLLILFCFFSCFPSSSEKSNHLQYYSEKDTAFYIGNTVFNCIAETSSMDTAYPDTVKVIQHHKDSITVLFRENLLCNADSAFLPTWESFKINNKEKYGYREEREYGDFGLAIYFNNVDRLQIKNILNLKVSGTGRNFVFNGKKLAN